jgi:hypothetical protein
MNESSGFDLRRAWRLVGVFAPVTIVALVPVALVAVTGTLWTQWLALAVMVVLVAGAGWTLMRGEPLFVRAGAAVACLVISFVALLLFYGWWTFGFAGDAGIDATAIVWYVMLAVPWVALVVGGTVAARAGRYPGNARVTIWWILAIGLTGLAYPAAFWMASNGFGDDLSPIVLFLIPPVACGLWAGPAILIGGLTLARRRSGVASEAAPPAGAVAAAPPLEVTGR